MSYHPHRMVPPVESRKRKEREFVHYNHHHMTTSEQVTTKPKPSSIPLVSAAAAEEPPINNRLLAGYMAYEFLTKGTLLGKKNTYNPARAEAGRAVAGAELDHEQYGYGEVANILKTEGTHIPSIVNPTQLACWIQM